MGGAAIRKIIDGRVYISARGASKLLGVSAKSVENWARQGKTGTGLPFEAKLTSTMRILVPLEAVDSLLTADASYKACGRHNQFYRPKQQPKLTKSQEEYQSSIP